MERPIDIQIENLKIKLIKMCSIVDDQVDSVIRALNENNHSLANEIIERDKIVDKYDVKIEKICHKIFALNQPVAMDLRIILSALKINANLERIGDLCVNLSHDIKDLNGNPEYMSDLNIGEISDITKKMIKKAIDSFIHNDSNIAKEVFEDEDRLDEIVRSNIGKIVEIMKLSPENVSSGLLFYAILQEFERMGDHATNIGEEVYFIVKAQTIKHKISEVIADWEEEV